jgi:hypothetical protein
MHNFVGAVDGEACVANVLGGVIVAFSNPTTLGYLQVKKLVPVHS